MGEMADWLVESHIEDYVELSYCDGRRRKSIRCKYCGKKGLHWKELESGKWWLFDKKSVIHKCYDDMNKLPQRFPVVKP